MIQLPLKLLEINRDAQKRNSQSADQFSSKPDPAHEHSCDCGSRISFWSQLEIVDIALVDDIPTVLNVLEAVSANFVIGKAWMASEFRDWNPASTVDAYARLLPSIEFEPHTEFKGRVPRAIGLIRTADTAPYANVILESA